jgi:hypothetical protein
MTSAGLYLSWDGPTWRSMTSGKRRRHLQFYRYPHLKIELTALNAHRPRRGIYPFIRVRTVDRLTTDEANSFTRADMGRRFGSLLLQPGRTCSGNHRPAIPWRALAAGHSQAVQCGSPHGSRNLERELR